MRRVVVYSFLVLLGINAGVAADTDTTVTKHPLAQEHPITIDATALQPPKVWSVPGVTEPLQSLTAYKTNQVKTLKLRPGRYMFTTTTISFEFTVDLEGKLEFAKMHDQCVSGRGSSHLTVSCRFTMPQ
jgi:anti-sigma factor ChrR (cupin superfamily)